MNCWPIIQGKDGRIDVAIYREKMISSVEPIGTIPIKYQSIDICIESKQIIWIHNLSAKMAALSASTYHDRYLKQFCGYNWHPSKKQKNNICVVQKRWTTINTIIWIIKQTDWHFNTANNGSCLVCRVDGFLLSTWNIGPFCILLYGYMLKPGT